MGVNLNLNFDGRKITKRLNTISKGVKNFTEPFNEAGDELKKYYGDKVFKDQGLSGQKWSPLKLATLKMRAERRGHYAKSPISTNKILVWTGTLSKGFKKTVEKFKLTIENTVFYFKYNQPKRKMLGINKEVIEIVLKSFHNYLRKLINK